MARFPKKLHQKIAKRKAENTLRLLTGVKGSVDFTSNDYLGFSKNQKIFDAASELLSKRKIKRNGATGSRLLSGNHDLYADLEAMIAKFHMTESALVFNSGYDANVGFFSGVPQRGDVVFYDEYIHASIRDGIKLGNAKSYKFKHNDLGDLGLKCQAQRSRNQQRTKGITSNKAEVYIVTESVFSMDGDSPDLKALAKFSKENNCHLVVDEAHAVGVFGENGEGLVQQLGLQHAVFARIITFGKAIGCHGAAVLGGKNLKEYLVNFARSFIYTTGLPPHSVATILTAYSHIGQNGDLSERLRDNIQYLNLQLETFNLKPFFIPSSSAIHCCVVKGNEKVRSIAEKIQKKGFDVRPILAPTVPEGQERLRICLHSFNSKDEIRTLLELLSILI